VATHLRCLVALLIFSALLWRPASGQNREGVTTKLSSTIFNFGDLAVKPTPVGERRDVVDLPTAKLEKLECHISTLNPGKPSHPPHRHPQEELIILRTGELEVFINGTKRRIGAGSLFFFASYDLHCVQNVGAIPAIYYVVNFATPLTHTLPAVPAVDSERPEQLRSAVYDWQKLVSAPTSTGERRQVFDSPTVTADRLHCEILTLNAGATATPGFATDDEDNVIVVKEGTLETALHGVVQLAVSGSVIYSAASDERTLKNVGQNSATYYAVAIRPLGVQPLVIAR
jgi:uncharacterized cupin superfamily protein